MDGSPDNVVHSPAPVTNPFHPDSDQSQRLTIATWLTIWHSAMQAQARRIDAVRLNVPGYHTEVYLFILALREVLRCAEWASTHTMRQGDGARASRIDQATNAFDQAVPGAADVRDILTHFDRYEQGKGKLQEDARKRAKERQRLVDQGHDLPPIEVPRLLTNQLFQRDGTTVKLHLLGYTVDVAAAEAAADALAVAVLDAVDDF